MRSKSKPASLNELMGKVSKDPEDMDLDDLKEILGEKMPELSFDRTGRLRLISALAQRFGPNYRQMPGVKNIISEFDEHIETENLVKQNRSENG